MQIHECQSPLTTLCSQLNKRRLLKWNIDCIPCGLCDVGGARGGEYGFGGARWLRSLSYLALRHRVESRSSNFNPVTLKIPLCQMPQSNRNVSFHNPNQDSAGHQTDQAGH